MRIILLPSLVRFGLFDRIIFIRNYLTSLADEILFDLQDMGFSDCPCCWPLGRTNRAPVLGRCQELRRFTRLTFSLGLASGPARLFFKPYQFPPSPCVRRACARAVSFLESGATSTCLLRAGLVRALSPSYVL